MEDIQPSIRPAQPGTDFTRIVDLINAVDSEPVTVEELNLWHQTMSPGRICQRWVAEREGQVVGYAVVDHNSWRPQGQFYVWVTVDAHWRAQGLGTALYETARAFLQEQSANMLTSEVRDNDPIGLRFAEQRGFKIHRHLFESTLDLSGFDEIPYLGLHARLEADRLRFFALADLPDTVENRRRLYELNKATGLDIPGSDGRYMPFEDFDRRVCGADWFNPAGQLFVADGDTWVAMAAVQLLPEKRGAYNLMTGVLQAYRGRKIGLALKLAAIHYAKEHNAVYIRTHNDSLNAPMLAINGKLGYQSQPGKYLLRNETFHSPTRVL